jgi:hypothetical protein
MGALIAATEPFTSFGSFATVTPKEAMKAPASETYDRRAAVRICVRKGVVEDATHGRA